MVMAACRYFRLIASAIFPSPSRCACGTTSYAGVIFVPPCPGAVGDELEWDRLGEDRAAKPKLLDGILVGNEIEGATIGADEMPNDLVVQFNAQVSHWAPLWFRS